MRLLGAALFLFSSASIYAQDLSVADNLQRTFEMPAHRSLVSVISDAETTLAPFESDGCSGGMSWSWRVVADAFPNFKDAQGQQPPWEECCVTHDRAYHDANGKTDASESFAARLEADRKLQQCVADPSESDVEAMVSRYDVSPERVRFAYGLIADSMFNAVRFGGGPCSGLPWRWGFGYPGCVAGF